MLLLAFVLCFCGVQLSNASYFGRAQGSTYDEDPSLGYKPLGCFKDTFSDRALPDYIGNFDHEHLVEKCYEAAKAKGYEVFGAQHRVECWSGPNGKETYDKHGKADNCVAGIGRQLSNFVYEINRAPAADCSKLLSAGQTKDGVYDINPGGQGSFQVYCDMTTDGGGWTVLQRNRQGSTTSFNHGWQEYKTGFGDLNGEFWLGLDKIRRLIKVQAASLRVDLEDPQGSKKYAKYSSFSIADESDFYRLHVSGYSGDAGDAISKTSDHHWINNDMKFSTPDKDNDQFPGGSCAVERKAGWWYNYCTNSDLNGDKTWWTISKAPLKKTEMKLR